LAAIGGLALVLQSRQQAAEVESANDDVAAQVHTALAHLDRGEWEASLEILEAAVGNDKATELDRARELLARARQPQLQALREQARRVELRQEADDVARDAERQRTEQRVREEETRQEEAQRRAEKRRLKEALRQQVARIGKTPVFRELEEFAAAIRKEQQEHQRQSQEQDKELLDALFQKAGKRDAGHKERVRKLLMQRNVSNIDANALRRWKDGVAKRISRKRAEVKERFRTYAEFGKADWPVFDREADQVLDQLANEIDRVHEDELGAGIQALLGK
jgi:hypothetical protein